MKQLFFLSIVFTFLSISFTSAQVAKNININVELNEFSKAYNKKLVHKKSHLSFQIKGENLVISHINIGPNLDKYLTLKNITKITSYNSKSGNTPYGIKIKTLPASLKRTPNGEAFNANYQTNGFSSKNDAKYFIEQLKKIISKSEKALRIK